MLEIARAKTEAPPRQDQLIQMATAHWVSRILYVAAEMNLADRLAEGPKTAEDLAQSTATDAPSLYRMMRTLASLGLFTEGPSHRFSLTLLGEAFKTSTVRATVLTLAGDLVAKSLKQLPYSVQTGKSGFEKAFGVPFFEYLAKHPGRASMFSETMVGFHRPEPAAVAAAYDFSQFETIIDVGGATGNLLATILGAHPEPRGILFGVPHVVCDAPALIEARGSWIASRSKPATSSRAFPLPTAHICSHISSTIGARPSA